MNNMSMQAMNVPHYDPTATGLQCPSCKYKGQHHIRYIAGNVWRCCCVLLTLVASTYCMPCCPRIYDNLIICGSCGEELKRVPAKNCDNC